MQSVSNAFSKSVNQLDSQQASRHSVIANQSASSVNQPAFASVRQSVSQFVNTTRKLISKSSRAEVIKQVWS